MTRYSDPIESGMVGLTSAQSTKAHVELVRVRRFNGGGNITWTGVFPYGARCVDAKLFIAANGSTATTDTFTISTSAGSTVLGTISSVGSATGVLRATTTGLGVISMRASACVQTGPNTEGTDVPFQVIMSSVDTATDYTLLLTFFRSFNPNTAQ